MVQQIEPSPDDKPALLNNAAWWQAWTLAERLELAHSRGPKDGQDQGFNADLAERKLKRWKNQHPFDQGDYFAERLKTAGLSEEELRFLLGESSASLRSRLPEIPAWLRKLALVYGQEQPCNYDELFAQIQATEANTEKTSNNRETSLGFLSAFFPLLTGEVEHLQAGIAELVKTYPAHPFEATTIHTVLLPCLPNRLLPQLVRTLTLELNVARHEGLLRGETPQERLQYFIQQLRQCEVVLPLLEEYAPLTRSVLTTLENWTRCSLDLLRHLCADWGQICQLFCAQADPGQLIEVNGGVGDLHKGGQSTLVLRFSSGFRLIYRPKAMAVDVHFQELLNWLNAHGDHPAFRTLTVLDCGSYGWAEFVTPQPCTSSADVARFYERQGGYLALLYALEATDVHFENLIASGEHPVMIDLESLFHPRVNSPAHMLSQRQMTEILHHSVLRVGLLPLRIWGNRKHIGVDISGLGGYGGQMLPRPMLRMDRADTDQLHFIRERLSMAERSNRPTLQGQQIDILDYKTDLIKGFVQVYRLLLQEREALLSGPIRAFAHDEIRFLARSTNIYGQLLFESYHPDFLRNALDRDRFFDRLWAAIERQPELQRLVAAERTDLHAGDIPLFTTCPDTRDIFTSKRVCIPGYLNETSLTSVEKRLRGLDEWDLTRQLWFIEASLATLLLSEDIMTRKQIRLETVQEQGNHAMFLKAACDIADRLVHLAYVDEHGAGWISIAYVNEREWCLLPTDTSLYDGTSGIAFFLAYIGAATGRERYTTLARAALAAVQEDEKELRKKPQDLLLGGFLGWGSLLYLYTHLGSLWQEETLLSRARDVTLLLPELVGQDTYLDFLSGSAGCLTTLFALYSVAPSAELLAIAIQCGDHLLRYASQCGGEPLPQSQELASRPLTGFSHGAAGMALSLFQLAEISGETRFREGAQQALAYERSVFSPVQQNWPDFRTTKPGKTATDQESSMTTWCHGAPGIGLARLASLPYQDDASMREDIAIALQTTLAQGFGMNHSLCHGDLGNLELLLTAAQTLENAAYYLDLTRTYATTILKSIEREGWLTGVPSSVESPGFMTGIAGIGYQLLRLAEPELVPPVLTLAPPTKKTAPHFSTLFPARPRSD
jgi:type 2 lantibiotic biosynthesis protein LanM